MKSGSRSWVGYWLIGSAVVMTMGAIGPWVTALGQSVSGGKLVQALARVGWGLNLALAASISLAVASLVRLLQPDPRPVDPVEVPSMSLHAPSAAD